MSKRVFTDTELEAYLDEDLPSFDMSQVEDLVRDDKKSELVARLAQINRRRDSGVHSLGEIWRRHRLSCPPRKLLGSFLLGVLSAEENQYIKFHVEQLGCRQCQANLEDLQSQKESTERDAVQARRRKYFQTSAGFLSQP